MPSRDEALAVIERLHEAQARLYGDGDPSGVRALLTDDVVWVVPGASPIAGSYRGTDAVIDYMLRRGRLADGTFRMHRGDVLSGEGDAVAVLTDGEAVVRGETRRWSTVGLYRLRDGRVAECRLMPFDQAEFDDIWSGSRDEVATPGRALVALGVGHAVWGWLAYGDALRDIARAGVVDSVGDGLFARDHARDARAAGFWFMFAAPMAVLLGYQLERASRSGDADAVTRTGWAVLAVSATGAAVIPRSGFWGALPLSVWTIVTGRRLRAR